MCGRFDVDRSNREIDRLLAGLAADGPPVRGNEFFPGSNALVLTMRDGVPAPEAMAWGFPRRDAKGVIFNARAESALQKPFFRNALLRHPAVIPATGFYEWRKDEHGVKDKFRFTDPCGAVLYLAGFWNTFADQEVLRHFTILTTAANADMREFHTRMPVLVAESEIESWLAGENRAQVLASEPCPLLATPA